MCTTGTALLTLIAWACSVPILIWLGCLTLTVVAVAVDAGAGPRSTVEPAGAQILMEGTGPFRKANSPGYFAAS